MQKRVETRSAGHPIWTLIIATILPGVGQVVNRMPTRGLVFVFYMLLLGIVTFNLTTPEHSLVGRYSGGIFIYALSVLDAYKRALFRHRHARQEQKKLPINSYDTCI
jgi:hypothetical protein